MNNLNKGSKRRSRRTTFSGRKMGFFMKMSRKSSKQKINLSNILNNDQLRDMNRQSLWGEDPEMNLVSNQNYGFFWTLKNRESGRRSSVKHSAKRQTQRPSSKGKRIMEKLIQQKSTVLENINRLNRNLNQISLKESRTWHRPDASEFPRHVTNRVEPSPVSSGVVEGKGKARVPENEKNDSEAE